MAVAPDWESPVPLASVHLPLRNWVPAEVQLPVEAAIRHVRAGHVLKRLVADDVDDGAHHSVPGTACRTGETSERSTTL